MIYEKEVLFRAVLEISDYMGNKAKMYLWEGIDNIGISAIQKSFNKRAPNSGEGKSSRCYLEVWKDKIIVKIIELNIIKENEN
ncbi:MAG: hypothetical protein KC589_07850 [Nanoarchaeota archaeon]|nr:hypothetical protein [Nanoarchaeota archaeon]